LTAEAHVPAPGPIPAPPDFPVAWSDPDDARKFWTHDRMHWPDPLPLILFDMVPEEGFNGAFADYGMPMRFEGRRVNGYLYASMAPLPLPPEELERRGKEAQEKLGAAMGRLGELWRDEWLPEIERLHAFWDDFDLAGAGMPALLEHLDRSVANFKRLWHLHFLIAAPAYFSISALDDLWRDLFGQDDPFGAYRLVQGFPNKTVEAGHALWALSRRARAVPAVRSVLEERAASAVVGALEATAEGRAFLADLRRYLAAFGQRGDKFSTLTDPSWIEDPTQAIKTLKDYLGQPDRDLDAEMADLAAERERAVASARERLQGYPRQVVEQFEFLLGAAQVGVVLSEDHAHWIDYSGTYKMRRVLLELGRRFAAAGVLASAADVVHLRLDEIRATAAALPGADRRALVADRKAELDRFARIAPPPALGTPPPGPPPADDPFARFSAKFFGVPPAPAGDPTELRGAPGSPGLARGRARIIRSLREADRLGRGEILVAETTAPPWTPLFATAGAVVTDTGGILSHCAVVAREYGIPAVVGVGAATTRIADGQVIEVDGAAGVVRLVES
jgi:pyruvate,water dikinase